MEYEFTNQFVKDLKRFQKDTKFIHLMGAKVNETTGAKVIDNIAGLRLIRGTSVTIALKLKRIVLYIGQVLKN